jgi:hypothetical protein
VNASGSDIGRRPISVSRDHPVRALPQRPDVSLVTYHISVDSSKYLDSAIIVNLRPEDVLRAILSDAADNVSWVKKIVPLHPRKQMLPQVAPNDA